MSTNETENPLATIPTDQLMLRFLQELAARVDKLEKRDEAPQPNSKVSDIWGILSKQDSTIVTSEERSSNHAAAREESQEIAPANDEEGSQSVCPKCSEIPQHCICILVPYGYMLDGDSPTCKEDLIKISDRYDILKETNRALAKRLRRLCIAGIPSDNRIPFKNFWNSCPVETQEYTMDVINDLALIWRGGLILIMDFDGHGNSTIYGNDRDCWIMDMIRLKWPNRELEVPLQRWNGLVGLNSSPWQRLMYVIPWENLLYVANIKGKNTWGHQYDENISQFRV
jgi:hypothetical protein